MRREKEKNGRANEESVNNNLVYDQFARPSRRAALMRCLNLPLREDIHRSKLE